MFFSIFILLFCVRVAVLARIIYFSKARDYSRSLQIREHLSCKTLPDSAFTGLTFSPEPVRFELSVGSRSHSLSRTHLAAMPRALQQVLLTSSLFKPCLSTLRQAGSFRRPADTLDHDFRPVPALACEILIACLLFGANQSTAIQGHSDKCC